MNIEKMSFFDLLVYIAKRFLLLVAKLCGYKGFTLFLATWLLWVQKLSEGFWAMVASSSLVSAGTGHVANALSTAQALKSVQGVINNEDSDDKSNGDCVSGDSISAVRCATVAGNAAGRDAIARGRAKLRAAFDESGANPN